MAVGGAYVCMIEEISGGRVLEGKSSGAVHLIGFFDEITEIERTFDAYKDATALRIKHGRSLLSCW